MTAAETHLSATAVHVSIWADLLGVDMRQHFVDAGGIRTRVLEAGSGPALVMIHGTGGHLEAYARNVRALSAHYRVVLYDMIGHGYTDKPDRPYTIDVMSDHLVAVLDALGIQTAHLSGESIGGWVAAWTAAHHGDRVGRLVLNTPGNITNKPQVMAAVRDSSLKAVREASPETVRARVEWLFHDTTMVTDELVALRLAIYTQPNFLQAMTNIVAVQDWEYREPYVWSPEWCGRIGAPTLLLWTDHDPTGTVEEAELLREWIPDARLEVIEGAGHWPQWEKPDLFHQAHLRFINGGM
jgi:2-hydroxy-6-oxonona-2,4-dienedioate hydrolase